GPIAVHVAPPRGAFDAGLREHLSDPVRGVLLGRGLGHLEVQDGCDSILHARDVTTSSRLRALALTRLPAWFTRRVSSLHRNMLKLSGGKFLGAHKGEPMILLATTGRKTGKV